jgi:hypothetical protein
MVVAPAALLRVWAHVQRILWGRGPVESRAAHPIGVADLIEVANGVPGGPLVVLIFGLGVSGKLGAVKVYPLIACRNVSWYVR